HTGEARNALVTALLGAPHVRSMVWDPPIASAHFTPGGRWLAVLHPSRDVDVWNLATRHRVATVHARTVPTSAAVSADGVRIAIGRVGGEGPVETSMRTFFTVPGDDPRFANLGYALSGANPRLLALGHFDGTVSVWDIVARRQVARLRGGDGQVVRVAFSADG